jgi:hypothetical protein
MSAFIGSVRGPNHNSPHDAAEVWCSRSDVELNLFVDSARDKRDGLKRRLDPVAARNLAALLVRGADECERMRARDTPEQR